MGTPLPVPGVGGEGVRPGVVHGAAGVIGPGGAGQDLVGIGHGAIVQAAAEGAAVAARRRWWGGLNY